MDCLMTKEINKKILNSSRKYFKREKILRLVNKIKMFSVISVDKQVTNNNFIKINAKTIFNNDIIFNGNIINVLNVNNSFLIFYVR